MTSEKQLAKNAAIKESKQQTADRHKNMLCRTYEVKIDASHLNEEQKHHLQMLFIEAKWLYNASIDLPKEQRDRNAKSVSVKVGDHFENRKLLYLGSQMKQDVVDQISSSVKTLSTQKAQDRKVGKLKHISECNSVPLRQYGTTYRIDFTKNTVSIQKMRKPMKVRGLKQIPANVEIANAKLIRKPSGLYFHITTYAEPVTDETTASVGLDFGVGTNITTSDNETFHICVDEHKRLKKMSRVMNRRIHKHKKNKKDYKTKNHRKRKRKLEAEYEKLNNRKADMANKVVHSLLSRYLIIGIQDELIAQWHHGLFGKQVQHSAMGKIKAQLKRSSKTIVVPASFASTQICPVCQKKTPHPLDKRDYDCQFCHYHHDNRDVKAAECILHEALRSLLH